MKTIIRMKTSRWLLTDLWRQSYYSIRNQPTQFHTLNTLFDPMVSRLNGIYRNFRSFTRG